MDNKLEIIHNKQTQCFEVSLEGCRAHLDYRLLDGQYMDYYNTFVPNALRAAMLTKAALEYAQQADLTVIPSCSYVETYIKRHVL